MKVEIGAPQRNADNITFSTVFGNVSAREVAGGKVEVKGFWGETDTSKKMMIKIGDSSTPQEVGMSSVIGKNFKITIPSNLVGTATKVKVYHSDYEPVALTVTILALDGDGNYVIKDKGQWDAFCTLVNSGVTFSGQTGEDSRSLFCSAARPNVIGSADRYVASPPGRATHRTFAEARLAAIRFRRQ